MAVTPPGSPEPGNLAGSAGDRRARMFGGGLRQEGAKGVLIALVSTAVVCAGLGALIVNAPGWDRVREAFFDGQIFVLKSKRNKTPNRGLCV